MLKNERKGKLKNKILLLLGILAIVFASNITSVNALTSESIFDDEFLERNAYQTSVAEKVDNLMKDTYKDSYPSYFGGMYINDDSTSLILQIVKDSIPNEDSKSYSIYSKIINMDGAIKVEYVKNSYAELQDVNNKVIEYYKAVDYIVDKAEFKNFVANYIDVKNNTVVVELLDNSTTSPKSLQELTNSFKNLVVDSDLIKFAQGKELIDQASLKAGQGITTKGQENNCSMGWRAKVDGKSGYITAAHCVNGLNDSLPTGTVKKYKNSGKVDAAFVQTTSSYTPSNSLMYTSGSIKTLDNTVCPLLSVGTSIAHAGVESNYKAGQIKALNYSGNYGGTVFTGLIATNYVSDGGDSGGAVFVPSLVNGGAPVAGIHKGTSSYGAAFVDANEIYSAFNAVRY